NAFTLWKHRFVLNNCKRNIHINWNFHLYDLLNLNNFFLVGLCRLNNGLFHFFFIFDHLDNLGSCRWWRWWRWCFNLLGHWHLFFKLIIDIHHIIKFLSFVVLLVLYRCPHKRRSKSKTKSEKYSAVTSYIGFWILFKFHNLYYLFANLNIYLFIFQLNLLF